LLLRDFVEGHSGSPGAKILSEFAMPLHKITE
jgi:hypothetical protein